MTRQHRASVSGLLMIMIVVGMAAAAAAAPAEAGSRHGGDVAPADETFELTFGIEGDRVVWLGVVIRGGETPPIDPLHLDRLLDPFGDLRRGVVLTRVAARFTLRALEQLLEHLG